MSRFQFTTTPLSGVVVVERTWVSDERGGLSRLFCSDELLSAGWSGSVAQVNHAVTRKAGTIRGMHFQRPPCNEMKLVSCLRGKVWDVALDLREGSPTFLKFFATELSLDNARALLIPEGVAHGFQALEDNCEILYMHSCSYSPSADDGLNPMDPLLGLPWPLPVTMISEKDRARPLIGPGYKGVAL